MGRRLRHKEPVSTCCNKKTEVSMVTTFSSGALLTVSEGMVLVGKPPQEKMSLLRNNVGDHEPSQCKNSQNGTKDTERIQAFTKL